MHDPRKLSPCSTTQGGCVRVSPGGHWRSNLVFGPVVYWTQLSVRVTWDRLPRSRRRGKTQCTDLVFGPVVYWTQLSVRVTRDRLPRSRRRGKTQCLGGGREWGKTTNQVCDQGRQELYASPDTSQRHLQVATSWPVPAPRSCALLPVSLCLPPRHFASLFKLCVCLLLQYLLKSCSRGGRVIVEDMCYERRRAEACVD